jgi:high-affinity iron transporter
MLRYSRKLPITRFFRYSALLVAILAVVLAGKGVGALQEAGMFPATLIKGLPRFAELGFYPSIETIAAQLAALFMLVIGFSVSHRAREPALASDAR